ncbi:hypothetical protein GP486_005305 [Trichoglossum hirsutum]|uniref:Uncharacterized protein n=1 Tax=Trichoglossum hirsutum TaxID=265104 RepID=A0A9P8L9F6_9PEZI|nr:hypothetical protein GP486_005305 [Trichoglossum hirsutum]
MTSSGDVSNEFEGFDAEVVHERLSSRFVISMKEVETLCDPFQRECQAYSRVGENHKIAVRCYGSVTFPTGHRDFSRFIQGVPLRGLVKELIPGSDLPFIPQQVGQMVDGFKTLMEMGIVMFNNRPDNYVGGRPRDLSESYTAPNRIPIILRRDLKVPVAQFNHMIENGMGSLLYMYFRAKQPANGTNSPERQKQRQH